MSKKYDFIEDDKKRPKEKSFEVLDDRLVSCKKVRYLVNGAITHTPPYKSQKGEIGYIYSENESGIVYRTLHNLDGNVLTINNEFYFFNGVVFEQLEKDEPLREALHKSLKEMSKVTINIPENYTEKQAEKFKISVFKDREKLKSSLTTNNGIKNVFSQLKSLTAVKAEEVNSYTKVVAFTNGVYDYELKEFIKKGDDRLKNYKLTKQMNIAFNEDAKEPKTFLRVLDYATNGNKEVQEDFLTLAGHAFIGVNKTQSITLLLGNSRNGKSTVLNAFAKILEPYMVPLDKNLFTIRQQTGHTEHIYNLKNARAVLGSEPEHQKTNDFDLIKNITGGELISASGKGKSTEAFEVVATFLIATNKMLNTQGIDNASKERFKILEFSGETIEDDKRDTSLPDKINKELEGIYQLMHPYIKKAVESNTVVISEHTKEYTKNIFSINDPYEQFYEEDLKDFINNNYLYFLRTKTLTQFKKLYLDWYKRMYFKEHTGLNDKTFVERFGEILQRKGFTSYKDIRLNYIDKHSFNIDFSDEIEINQHIVIEQDTSKNIRGWYNHELACKYADFRLKKLQSQKGNYLRLDKNALNKIKNRKVE